MATKTKAKPTTLPPKRKPRRLGSAKAKKKEARKRQFRLPMYVTARVPDGNSPLLDFILSCEGEVDSLEAIREYQSEWCDHPRKMQTLHIVRATAVEGYIDYEMACCECGIRRVRKGRPPTWLQQQ